MRALNLLLTLLFQILGACCRSRSDLILENLALRHQLGVLMRTERRLRFKPEDRLVWVALRRSWRRWRDALILVRPETVVAWQRQAFRRPWRSLSRRPGRSRVEAEIRELLVRRASENPT